MLTSRSNLSARRRPACIGAACERLQCCTQARTPQQQSATAYRAAHRREPRMEHRTSASFASSTSPAPYGVLTPVVPRHCLEAAGVLRGQAQRVDTSPNLACVAWATMVLSPLCAHCGAAGFPVLAGVRGAVLRGDVSRDCNLLSGRAQGVTSVFARCAGARAHQDREEGVAEHH